MSNPSVPDMKAHVTFNTLLLASILVFEAGTSLGQATTNTVWEVWPSLKANVELTSRRRLQLFDELEKGDESPFLRFRSPVAVQTPLYGRQFLIATELYNLQPAPA